MTIAEKAVEYMKEHDINHVMWGDGAMVSIGHYAGHGGDSHPLDVMAKVCKALRRAPHLFEHSYIRGHDSRGHSRLVCGYKLREFVVIDDFL